MLDETFSAALKEALAALPIADFYLRGDVPEGLPALDRKALEGSLDVVLPAVLDELEKAESFAEDFQIGQPEWKSYHFDLAYDETETVLWAGVFFIHGTPGYGRILSSAAPWRGWPRRGMCSGVRRTKRRLRITRRLLPTGSLPLVAPGPR